MVSLYYKLRLKHFKDILCFINFTKQAVVRKYVIKIVFDFKTKQCSFKEVIKKS